MSRKSVGFIVMGGLIIGAALFAEAIGLDNDPGWGKGRAAVLVFGCLVTACGALTFLFPDQVSLHRIPSFSNTLVLPNLLRRYWYTVLILLFVIFIYIWFASSGSWVHWVSPTRYYADLANSFKRGDLNLLTRPDPRLLELSDPYDPSARRGVEAPIDYSLYKRKFYLYWGPVPALILVMISPFTHGRVGDLYLVFSFVCGILVCLSLLAIVIWDRFFRNLSRWMLLVSILILGLTAPWTYMLINEPNGRIYEAAIAGAQFFLLGGFFVAVMAFQETNPWHLTVIGFFWALAIGTRLIMLLPVGFLSIMIPYRIWRTTGASPKNFALKLLALTLPLVLSLICLGWYNWTRFGSVTETGFSYALAGVNLQKFHDVFFSPVYAIQNLYNYTLTPPANLTHFPFLYPEQGTKNELFEFYSLPNAYETSPITGLLFIVPFAVFAIVPLLTLFVNDNQTEKQDDKTFLNWITISLLGAFASAFGLLLIFFWAAMRYMADFIPVLSLMSVLGFWQGYQLLRQKPIYRKFYSVLGIILISEGIAIGILLSLAVKQIGRTGI